MMTLYQAEWCPYSSAVRELLTELGITFTAAAVEPWPEQRDELRRVAGTDEIPVLVTDDGEVLRGSEAILAHLASLPPGPHAGDHRRRYEEHRPAREADATGRLLRGLD